MHQSCNSHAVWLPEAPTTLPCPALLPRYPCPCHPLTREQAHRACALPHPPEAEAAAPAPPPPCRLVREEAQHMSTAGREEVAVPLARTQEITAKYNLSVGGRAAAWVWAHGADSGGGLGGSMALTVGEG